jgi:hypothetical protein
MGNVTKLVTAIVECGRTEDYEIDECELCEAPVLRPVSAPDHAEAICSYCLPDVKAAAAKLGAKMNTQKIPPVAGMN